MQVAFIGNFAAIHREPGHQAHEYFETNLLGAEHVCHYAESIGCDDILFTSSISPYGVSKSLRSELSVPMPETPYGSSKLAAEWIHKVWQSRDQTVRRLLIIRPGVIFGPGEGGNVSRLVKMITKRRFFVYLGNPLVAKAGLYIKELCNATWWLHEAQKSPSILVANMTMYPCPTIKGYVESIERVSQVKAFVPTIHEKIMMALANVIQTTFGFFGLKTNINKVRIRKLIWPNNIRPDVLIEKNYQYLYTLDTALKDWRKEMPSEW